MIKKVILENFQCHEHKEVTYTDGLNVVTGTSDTGKSAVQRAIEWVRTNRPLGSDFITHGKTTCSVLIETDKGTVKREKSPSFNGYYINGSPYDAVGKSVPDEVVKILGITDTNVQNQFDPLFLLMVPSSEVMRQLNSYANLSEGDTVLNSLNTNLLQSEKEYKNNKKTEEQLNKELLSFSKLPEIKDAISLYEVDKKKVKFFTLRKELLVKNIDTYNKTNKYVNIDIPSISGIGNTSKRLEEIKKEVINLKNLISKKDKVEKIANIEINININKLNKNNEVLKEKKKSFNNLSNLINKYNQHCNTLTLYIKEIDCQKEKLSYFIGSICPECGQEIKELF